MSRSRIGIRRLILRRILHRDAPGSQEEICRRLEQWGHCVTQTTISRDLAALGAFKSTLADGREGYVLSPEEKAGGTAEAEITAELVSRLEAFVIDMVPSGNLIVLKTLPGAAPTVAAALDRASDLGLIGTLAGDDTVLGITASPRGATSVEGRLVALLETGQ